MEASVPRARGARSRARAVAASVLVGLVLWRPLPVGAGAACSCSCGDRCPCNGRLPVADHVGQVPISRAPDLVVVARREVEHRHAVLLARSPAVPALLQDLEREPVRLAVERLDARLEGALRGLLEPTARRHGRERRRVRQVAARHAAPALSEVRGRRVVHKVEAAAAVLPGDHSALMLS